MEIAAVTHLLKAQLQSWIVKNDFGGALEAEVAVTSSAPDVAPEPGRAELNVTLLRVSHAPTIRQAPSPGDPEPPGPALKLEYLVSARGVSDSGADSLLAGAIRAFAEVPVLTPHMVRAQAAQDAASGLPHTNLLARAMARLADQAAAVRIIPQDLDLNTATSLWTALAAPLRASLLFQVGPVELGPRAETASPPIVRIPARRKPLADIEGTMRPAIGRAVAGPWPDRTGVTLNDLILPPDRIAQLQAIPESLRPSGGDVAKGARGAMFIGAEGSGRTAAAQALASQCGLAVSRVGLGSLLGASLQETEKNIDRVFDAAAGSGVLLLFDEAEALFGKRSDVRDAHERYANVEIAYLLQRMESHAGITVLRTSGRENIEAAFLRRLRHWVVFPFPDSAAREALWRRALPDAVALADMTRLAKLQLNGGAIRTLIDRAALAATSAAEPPRLRHILATARENRMRGGAPVTAAEFGDPGEAD